ncbi:hypothetical protein [Komagataeibacter diospyri]|nr:hypothetical protein [Komagataeibacter diospyri]GCE88686.1 hypothetical protein MSKU15_0287 [Komagataeibacter diospyri]
MPGLRVMRCAMGRGRPLRAAWDRGFFQPHFHDSLDDMILMERGDKTA